MTHTAIAISNRIEPSMERSKSLGNCQSTAVDFSNRASGGDSKTVKWSDSRAHRPSYSQTELDGASKSACYDHRHANNRYTHDHSHTNNSFGDDHCIQYRLSSIHCSPVASNANAVTTINKSTHHHHHNQGLRLRSSATNTRSRSRPELSSSTLPHRSSSSSVLLLTFALLLVLCGSQPCIVNCDIFSSTAHIQSLMHLERHLVSSLTSYIENVEEKMFQVKSYLSEFAYTAGQTRYAGTYAENLMENPLQAFQLVKRLTVNWNKIRKVMDEDSWLPVNKFIDNYRTLMPSHDDLNGAALGLIRLQDTYNLNMTDLADGRINGMNSMIEMSARDCLYLGKNAFNNGYYGHSLEWFDEALVRAHREGNRTATVEEIMPFYRMAIDYHDKLSNEFQQNDYPKYSDKLRIVEGDSEDYKSYQKLCRGEQIETYKESNPSEQRCFFTTNNRNPYLVIRPLKVELFSERPYVAMYHDLISDQEIATYKELATPILARARVQTDESDNEISKVRVSQTAWFSDNSHPMIAKINARIEAITGFSTDMDSSDCELLQIANYGIGGHYIPHYDYLVKDKAEEDRENVSEKEKYAGDRIATFMFYLSNVSRGGATVFTRLGIRVTPVKGAAIFWYNLLRNGEGIMDTVHGACPVLVGEKWVANYWIRENGQIFRRPCTLDPEE